MFSKIKHFICYKTKKWIVINGIAFDIFYSLYYGRIMLLEGFVLAMMFILPFWPMIKKEYAKQDAIKAQEEWEQDVQYLAKQIALEKDKLEHPEKYQN